MSKELNSYLKKPQYIIPNDLLKKHQDLDLNLEEMLAIIYFLNQHNLILFNLEQISTAIGLEGSALLKVIESLQKKKLIKISLVDAADKKKREYIDISGVYEQLISLNKAELSEKNDRNLYQVFENEFARALSPIEYEIINSWLNDNHDIELIKAALKEATYNNVKNLRYIDKILYEWKRNGITKASDVKQKKKPKIEKADIFDYNWLDE